MTDRSRSEPPLDGRLRAALAGEVELADLNAAERRAINLELDRRILDRASAALFGEIQAAEGITTVAFEDGRLVEQSPGGSKRFISSPQGR